MTQLVLERLALERVGRLAGCAAASAAGVRAAAACGREQGEPAEAERRRGGSRACRPDPAPRGADSRTSAAAIAGARMFRWSSRVVLHGVSSELSASPRHVTGLPRPSSTVIWSPGWMVSSAGSALGALLAHDDARPVGERGDDLDLVAEVHLGDDLGRAALLAVPSGSAAGAAAIRSGRMPIRTRSCRARRWPRPRTTTPEPASTAKPPSAASTHVAVEEVHVADEVGHERRQRPVVDRARLVELLDQRRST